MIEFLNETILWWHWIVLGFLLLIIEMNTGTFLILGLGLSSVLVGILDLGIDISFTSEVIVWTVLSIFSLVAWKRWSKNEEVSKSGQSDYSLNTLGTVVTSIEPHKRGKVSFDTPILGNTSWTATATATITKGTRVKIVEIHGQLIEVSHIT